MHDTVGIAIENPISTTRRVGGFSMTRVILFLAATASVALAGSASAQSNDELLASRRCESELNFIMARDNGGRNPDAMIDTRRQDIRQASPDSVRAQRSGQLRSRRQRSRSAVTYTCRVDVRSGQVNAQYRWSGSGWDSGYDRPNEFPPPPPPAWNRPGGSGGSVPDGSIWQSGGLIGRASGKAIDVANASTRDSANVQLWQFGGGENQRWDIIDLGRGQYAIISQNSNKALDVAGGSREDGANVQQFRWNGSTAQRWRFERSSGGFFQIVNVNSGKCIDVREANTNNGANIQQWSCSGGANQAWKIQK